MRWLALVVFALGMAQANAAECTFETARFDQPDGWTVQFQPVPRDSSPSQTASFILTLRSGVTLTGGIAWPNGYTTPLWFMEGPCSPENQDICRFTGDDSITAYVLGESGIERLPHEMTGPPPRQILLPRLGSSIWYSFYRGSEFEGDADPGDVLTFAGCTTQ